MFQHVEQTKEKIFRFKAVLTFFADFKDDIEERKYKNK